MAASVLTAFVEDIINVASKLSIEHEVEHPVELQPELRKSSTRLAKSLMHDLHFSGNKSRKVFSKSYLLLPVVGLFGGTVLHITFLLVISCIYFFCLGMPASATG